MGKHWSQKQRSLFVPRQSAWAKLGIAFIYLLGAAIGISALAFMLR